MLDFSAGTCSRRLLRRRKNFAPLPSVTPANKESASVLGFALAPAMQPAITKSHRLISSKSFKLKVRKNNRLHQTVKQTNNADRISESCNAENIPAYIQPMKLRLSRQKGFELNKQIPKVTVKKVHFVVFDIATFIKQDLLFAGSKLLHHHYCYWNDQCCKQNN